MLLLIGCLLLLARPVLSLPPDKTGNALTAITGKEDGEDIVKKLLPQPR